MRQLALIGLLMITGLIGGLVLVSSNHLLGGFMGAIIGIVVAVVILAFPRDHDDRDDRFFWD